MWNCIHNIVNVFNPGVSVVLKNNLSGTQSQRLEDDYRSVCRYVSNQQQFKFLTTTPDRTITLYTNWCVRNNETMAVLSSTSIFQFSLLRDRKIVILLWSLLQLNAVWKLKKGKKSVECFQYTWREPEFINGRWTALNLGGVAAGRKRLPAIHLRRV